MNGRRGDRSESWLQRVSVARVDGLCSISAKRRDDKIKAGRIPSDRRGMKGGGEGE